MNDLDRQLAELALINKVDLQSNSVNSSGKKIGPAVPPKPKKNQPQVCFLYKLAIFSLINNLKLIIWVRSFHFGKINVSLMVICTHDTTIELPPKYVF